MIYSTEDLERYVLRYEISSVVRHYYLLYLESTTKRGRIKPLYKKVGEYYRQLLKIYSLLISEFCDTGASYADIVKLVFTRASMNNNDKESETITQNNPISSNDIDNDVSASVSDDSNIDANNPNIRRLPFLELCKLIKVMSNVKKQRFQRLMETYEKKLSEMEQLFIEEYSNKELPEEFITSEGTILLTPNKFVVLNRENNHSTNHSTNDDITVMPSTTTATDDITPIPQPISENHPSQLSQLFQPSQSFNETDFFILGNKVNFNQSDCDENDTQSISSYHAISEEHNIPSQISQTSQRGGIDAYKPTKRQSPCTIDSDDTNDNMEIVHPIKISKNSTSASNINTNVLTTNSQTIY